MARDAIEFDLIGNTKSALKGIKTVSNALGSLNSTITAGSIGGAVGGISGAFGLSGAFQLANTAVNAIPGVNQVGGLFRDAFLSNTSSVYAKADAIGSAYQRTRDAIGLAGDEITGDQATSIFKEFQAEEFADVEADISLREKLAPEVFEALKKNAAETPQAILKDIFGLFREVADFFFDKPENKGITE